VALLEHLLLDLLASEESAEVLDAIFSAKLPSSSLGKTQLLAEDVIELPTLSVSATPDSRQIRDPALAFVTKPGAALPLSECR